MLLVVSVVVLSAVGLVRSGYYTEPRREQWREAVDRMLSDPRFDRRSDGCLSVAAPGFQYYVNQRLPEYRIADATLEVLRDLLRSRPAPPVVGGFPSVRGSPMCLLEGRTVWGEGGCYSM